MNRYYYMSDNLDLLEELQDELETRGVDPVRIHLLTEEDAEVYGHHLHEVDSLSKRDMVRYGLKGALVGLVLALLVILVGLATGLMMTVWAIPLLFLSAVLLGFCTWEGGLIGAHKPNAELRRFGQELQQGRHLLYVDAEDNESPEVSRVVSAHPGITEAGTGKAGAFNHMRGSLRRFIESLP